MKTLSALVLALTLSSTAAMADQWGPGPGDWNRPGHPGWGRQCTVSFKKCDFNINGFCVKWNHKAFQVSWREARWACHRAQQEYGQIKNCHVQCN